VSTTLERVIPRKEDAMDEKQLPHVKDGATYEPPAIKDHGDLVDLTALQGSGGFTDAAFPAGTPAGDITYGSTP
jgi:hypothetical protein